MIFYSLLYSQIVEMIQAKFDHQTLSRLYHEYSSVSSFLTHTYIFLIISLSRRFVSQFLVRITDSIAKFFPILTCHILFQFFVFIFHSWKIRGGSSSSEFYWAWLFARKNPGLPRTSEQDDLENVLAWRHISVYAMARWKKEMAVKFFSRNMRPTRESTKAR